MGYDLSEAAAYVAKIEPGLAATVAKSGIPPLVPHTDYLRELVSAIISQQVSTKAAYTIFNRFLKTFDDTFPSAATLAHTPVETLRGIGMSGVKSRYVLDLAANVHEGRLDLSELEKLDDETVIRRLTAVRGIGNWTAQIFLMFCLGRPDVLAPTDIGIQMGVQRLFGLDHRPSLDEVSAIAFERQWSPYQSIFCWYLWRLLSDDLYLYEKRLPV